jgi:hypothetical protein
MVVCSARLVRRQREREEGEKSNEGCCVHLAEIPVCSAVSGKRWGSERMGDAFEGRNGGEKEVLLKGESRLLSEQINC